MTRARPKSRSTPVEARVVPRCEGRAAPSAREPERGVGHCRVARVSAPTSSLQGWISPAILRDYAQPQLSIPARNHRPVAWKRDFCVATMFGELPGLCALAGRALRLDHLQCDRPTRRLPCGIERSATAAQPSTRVTRKHVVKRKGHTLDQRDRVCPDRHRGWIGGRTSRARYFLDRAYRAFGGGFSVAETIMRVNRYPGARGRPPAKRFHRGENFGEGGGGPAGQVSKKRGRLGRNCNRRERCVTYRFLRFWP